MRNKFSRIVWVALGMMQCVAATLPAGAQDSAASQVLVSRGKEHFNVFSYGAVGNGKNLDSPAINRAIDACAQAGGGTVYLPAGVYLCGSIHLKSKINLFLDAGAVILGAPQEMKAYDPSEEFAGMAYQDGGHTYFHNSLIWGENLTDVSITGQGMINGGGLTKDDREVGQGSIKLGDKAIALKRCRNVLLRDVTIFHGGHFAVLLTGCDNVTVDNVTIDTNRDGIDIDCCRNTMVSNCRINSPSDDGLCPKSTLALGTPVITENLTIVNCQVSAFLEGTLLDGTMKPTKGGTGRIKFGTESNGGFRNCAVANCTFRNCCGLALEEVDGGTLENITINNISMMDVLNCPIYITLGRRNRGPNVNEPGTVRNVFISNVIATGVSATSGIQVTGLPGDDVESIRLENIRIHYNGGGTAKQAGVNPPELDKGYPEPGKIGVMPTYGLFARHVKDLELANIRFSYEKEDVRPALGCVDVNGLTIDNFKAQIAEGVPVAKFEVTGDVTIRNSPALEEWAAKEAKAGDVKK